MNQTKNNSSCNIEEVKYLANGRSYFGLELQIKIQSSIVRLIEVISFGLVGFKLSAHKAKKKEERRRELKVKY